MTGQSPKQIDRRIGYIDALKGFAILCVVLGHIAMAYRDTGAYPEMDKLLDKIIILIYAFHMRLFMMLSGYLYYTAYFNDSGIPDRKRIYRQIFNQIVIYVIFSVAMGLSKVLVVSITGGVLSVNEFTLLDIALIWIKPTSVYWYLYVLILLYLIFSIKQVTEVNRWVLLGVFTVTAICGKVVGIPWFEISDTLYYAIYFFIGIATKKYKDWIIGNKYLTFVSFVVAVGVLILIWNKEQNELEYMNWIIILNTVVPLGISLALWNVFEHVNFIGNSGILKLCGRYSLEIYTIHMFFAIGLVLIFPKVGIQNVYIGIVLGLIISTAIPILFSILCKRLNIHGLFFKPVTYMTEKMAAYKVGDRT